MTAHAGQLELSAQSRYGIATASSVAFHALALIAIGLLAMRAPAPPAEVLIPVELTVSGQVDKQLELPGGGKPVAPATQTVISAALSRPTPKSASSPGGRAKAAPAPPRILTSKKGIEPVGATGSGREASGTGGQSDQPAGPTKGPGIVGGPVPIYPKDALDGGLEGRVSLSVTVGQDGSVSKVAVATSSGHQILDDAAVRAVKRGWSFEPALKNGKPVASAIAVTFEFVAGKVESSG